MKEIPIKDEYIKLDQFLKFVNLVSSGIEAKMIIKDGQDRKSTRLNSSHRSQSRMPSSA